MKSPARSMADLRADLSFWQAALGLQHWRITLKRGKSVNSDPKPFSNEILDTAVAHSWWAVESPNAVVALLPSQGTHTLVHELIHIRLEGHLDCPAKYDALYERAINHLADALLGRPDLIG